MATRDGMRGWWIPLPFLIAALVIGIRDTASQVGQPRHAVTVVRSEGAWESVLVALGDGFSLRLRYRKHASPDMARWLEFEVDNRTGGPLVIRDFGLSMDYELRGSSSHSLISGNEAQVLPKDAGERWPPALTVQPGKLRLHGNLSAKAAARLPITRGSTARLRIRCRPNMITEQGHTTRTCGDMPPTVELLWHRPSKPQLAVMRQRLEKALEDPDAAVAGGYDIGAWIQKPAISAHLGPKRLLRAMSRCGIRSNARFAILRHLAGLYGGHPSVHAHYLERLRAGEEAALEELSRAAPWFPWRIFTLQDRPAGSAQPTPEVPGPRALWSPAFIAPIVRLMEETPRALPSGFGLLEHHGAPQAGDPALAARLGDVLRKHEVLVPAQARDRREHGRHPYFEAFRLIAMTRDPSLIPLLIEKLDDRTVHNELRGYPEHWSFTSLQELKPPARRTCDGALEALLRLRGADMAKAYEAAGWSVDNHRAVGRPVGAGKGWALDRMTREESRKLHAERGRWLDALRDRMIKDLREELGR